MQMKSDVHWPSIPYQEYAGRIERARQCLADHGLDAMILFSPADWWYYGGFTDAAQMCNGIWRTALIVSQERDPVAVADTNFVWTLRHNSWVEDLRYHCGSDHPAIKAVRSGEDFYAVLYDLLRELQLDTKTLGMETGREILTYLGVDEFLEMQEALPQARFVSAESAIFAQRAIKTPYEQDVMREGCRRACLCHRAAFEAIHPGVNERDVHRVFWQKALELDLLEAPYQGTWLCFSSNPAETLAGHRWITGAVDRIIREGDCGHSDCGPTYKMYQMDFQRAFSVGEPSAETRRYYDIGRDAFLETLEAIRPGVPFSELFRVSIEGVTKRGAPPHTIAFIGHGEGLANHEPPWIVKDNDDCVQEGMVLAIEVGAFDPSGAHFGGMLEDVVLVTKSGIENLIAPYLSQDLYLAG
jgi:Xaa-Pro aminopeptidase